MRQLAHRGDVQGLGSRPRRQLFGLDYEPLLRAINHVLFVSKMADATAAEVATSVSRYDAGPAGPGRLPDHLDLLVAAAFRSARGNEHGRDGEPSRPDQPEEVRRLAPGRQGAATGRQGETLAQRPDRRFFHWEIEFPEVFFGFIDADERQIKHKERFRNGSAGFDSVVGNPPYVRQEAIKPLKTFLKKTYQTFDSTQRLMFISRKWRFAISAFMAAWE